jgi:hypothetical protein
MRLACSTVKAERRADDGGDESTKSKVRIFTVGEHGQNVEILNRILRHVEIRRFEKCGIGERHFAG